MTHKAPPSEAALVAKAAKALDTIKALYPYMTPDKQAETLATLRESARRLMEPAAA